MKHIILFGNDSKQIFSKVNQITQTILKKNPDAKIEKNEGDIETLFQKELFEEKKIFLLYNLNSTLLNKIFQAFEQIQHILIFIFTHVDKNPLLKLVNKDLFEIESFILPKPYQIIKEFEKRLPHQRNKNILELLSNSIQSIEDIEEIIDKLNFYKLKSISFKNIDLIFENAEHNLKIFLLEEALFTQNKKLTLNYLNYLAQDKKEISKIIPFIRKTLINLIEIRKKLLTTHETEIIQELPYHPFYAKKLLNYAKLFSLSNLKQNLATIYKTEYQIRKYERNSDYWIERFILLF